eukprot:COSAG02_NODE_582_length_20017_cov_26.599608_4_plen_76_part_00
MDHPARAKKRAFFGGLATFGGLGALWGGCGRPEPVEWCGGVGQARRAPRLRQGAGFRGRTGGAVRRAADSHADRR